MLAAESRLQETVGLAMAINLNVVYSQIHKLKEVKPAAFFSRGFIEQFKDILVRCEAELVVVDAALSPVQQRNLEKALNVKVIDRTVLILEIFGERAKTREGKLQVALAHLTYQRSRLVRSWTHLERQRGGAGFLGGPGEKQIEIDRRLIDEKIIKLRKELEKVKNTRTLQRGNRRKVPYAVAALVGYTNAGKSSLFNRLSGSSVLAADMLFATLDPNLRKIRLPSGREIILSDTVGFISDLPHELIMAFRSTLEEVLEADLILHVRDCANPETDTQRKDVLAVLEHLGLNEIEKSEKYIEVLNKADLLTPEDKIILGQRLANRSTAIISVSALTGQGCDDLLKLIDAKLADKCRCYRIKCDAADGRLQAWLHQNGEIISRTENENCFEFQVLLSPADANRLRKLFNLNPD